MLRLSSTGLQFQSKREQIKLDPAIINYERGVDDYYFANAFCLKTTAWH